MVGELLYHEKKYPVNNQPWGNKMDLKKILTVLILVVILVVIVVNYTNFTQGGNGTPLLQYATFTPEPSETASPAEESSEGELEIADIAPTRTPAPTATPGVISQQIAEFTKKRGIQNIEFLGLSVEDWINLSLSILIGLAGYIIGTWLIRRALPRIFKKNNIKFGNEIIDAVGEDIRWIVVLFTLNYSVTRLTFISAEIKIAITDIFFVLMLVFVARGTFKLIDLAKYYYTEKSKDDQHDEEMLPIITLTARIAKVIAIVLVATILLSYFGINITGLLTVLGLGGLAISLAAQDTIADAIAGFIILVDRPFRVGDRIEIEKVGTWGDVVEIGIRTTRIRTRDNRMVIVPNSIIGSNEVINYSYPDPRYRIETHIDIAYGTDIEKARQVIIDAVRQLPGVLADKPVDALYIEMGDFAMRFRVRWWVESYVDTRRMMDQIHTALDKAFAAAGIESPYPTQYVIFHDDPETPQLYRRQKDKQDPVDNSGENQEQV